MRLTNGLSIYMKKYSQKVFGDIGLSEDNVARIRMEMHDASEKARVWVGNALKTYRFRGYVSNLSVSLERASRNDSYFLVKMIQFAQENGDSLSIKKVIQLLRFTKT